MALVISYSDFDQRTIELLTVKRGAPAQLSMLDHDRGSADGQPWVGMTASGELVALWATAERGIWASHRPPNSTPSAAFVVEPPFFQLGTPGVEGVYPRGDGRFVLAWRAGTPGVRTPIELRDFSIASGLGPRLSIPYQNTTGTNSTMLRASPRGISAVWWYFRSDGGVELDAMQHFIP